MDTRCKTINDLLEKNRRAAYSENDSSYATHRHWLRNLRIYEARSVGIADGKWASGYSIQPGPGASVISRGTRVFPEIISPVPSALASVTQHTPTTGQMTGGLMMKKVIAAKCVDENGEQNVTNSHTHRHK